MSWSEFRLRLFAFNRQYERDLYMQRNMAWASHMTPRKGQRIDSWWKIKGNKPQPRVTDEHKQRFLAEYQKYLDKKEHGRA